MNISYIKVNIISWVLAHICLADIAASYASDTLCELFSHFTVCLLWHFSASRIFCRAYGLQGRV